MTQSFDRKILLAERVPALRNADAALLRELGYREITASGSGTEAWSTIKNNRIDFVIAGWDLKEMNGLVLLKVLRADAHFSTIPYMLVVEEITKSQVVSAGEAGVTEILVRPFSKEVFKRKVADSLDPELDQQSVEVKNLMETGEELVRRGRYEEALSKFKRVMMVYDSAEVYYNLGYIKTAQGKFEEAIIAFRKATQINNAYAQAFQKMGEVYAKLGRIDEAQQCFERAAEIYMEKNMDENAEELYMEALKINPNTLNVYNSLGILYRRQGRLKDSIRMYRKALRVNPEDENIYYNLARVFISVNSPEKAVDILEKALKINPGFSEAAKLIVALRSNGKSNRRADQ